MTCFGMSVLSNFRRRVRLMVSPFKEPGLETEEYYKLRSCFDLDLLSHRAYHLHNASPLSSSAQRTLAEWLDDMIIECVDDCLWTPELQEELDLFYKVKNDVTK